MSQPSGQARVIQFFEQVPLVAAILVIAVSAGTLFGWYAGFDPTTGFYPGGIAMLPLTSVAFILVGTALALITKRDRPFTLRVASVVLACIVVLITLIEASAWIAGRDLGLDLLMFGDQLRRAPWNPPGRMAVNTLSGVLLVSLGVLALPVDDRTGRRTAHWLGLIGGVVGFLGLIGYAFGVSRLYSVGQFSGMSVSTAGCLFVLALGIVFARRTGGLPKLLVDPGAAGSVARRLVPAAVFVPFLLGWIRLVGEKHGLYDTPFGVSMYVVATVVIFLWMVNWSARMAFESDRVKEELLAGEQKAREVAESANTSKGNFLAVMSHELRTPLSAIIGYEELLADGITGPVNEAQKHQLGRVKASAQHLLHLIDQILSYSRVDAGREVVQAEDVDANELAQDAATLVEPLARDRGLPLEVIPTGYVLPMSTDSGKVRQILVNLLSNSVKFTPAGRVTLVVQHDGATVRYIVRDTGIGIASEHRDQIFDAFWQVEQPSTRRVGGTGLGLSVTRRLAQLLGGDVTVESTVGQGSAFTVSLPLEAPIPRRAVPLDSDV
ncbi:MAG: HAMP domain-containing sensor histidine kinase [Gemmatimonadaceae bacterium]